jgi:glucosyl-3-phosphoglycerate synthase
MPEPGPVRRTRRSQTGGILIPVLPGLGLDGLILAGEALRGAGRLQVLGVVPVVRSRSLSKATGETQRLRSNLLKAVEGSGARARPRILVSHHPEFEIAAEATRLEIDLVLMPWLEASTPLRSLFDGLLSDLDCEVALLKGRLPGPGGRLLVLLRGGPDSQLALRLALRLNASRDYPISTLLLQDSPPSPTEQAELEALGQVLEHLPYIRGTGQQAEASLKELLERTGPFDLVVIGAGRGHPGELGSMAQALLERSPSSVLVVRARPPDRKAPPAEAGALETISILVDKWFAENTFHAREFEALKGLLELKRERGLSISLALPSLNEDRTVGKVIRTMQRALMKEVPLLDEMVLIDSDSTDRTRQIAEELGIPVYRHPDILPKYGPRQGKGEALWKSLYVTRGDLVLWIDTDIVNIHPRFVYGLIGPLLLRRDLMFVKGFYLRPMRVGRATQAGGGGRVTELTARPLLNLFYPALSGLIQPLSGEYGGRREALEQVPFSSGYGVETGLLIDVLEQFGLSAIGQVDLQERIHHNQPLTALSMMSFAIIQTVMRKLDRRYGRAALRDINRSMKIIRHSRARFFLEVEEIAERERPPMIELPEYRERFGRP